MLNSELTTILFPAQFRFTNASRNLAPSCDTPGPRCKTRGDLSSKSERRSKSDRTVSRRLFPGLSHSPTSWPVANRTSQNSGLS